MPCKISDGLKIYKCKVKLKGIMIDHWFSKTRFSMRVKIKDGYINGLNDFSIHKARSRQFPYDQIFHKINSDLEGLSSSNQDFVNLDVNNENWGIMNIEPTINSEFLEQNRVKRIGVFQVSNKENARYKYSTNNQYLIDHHFISDPTIFLSLRGTDKKMMNDENFREIYSFIYQSLNLKNSKIFDREKMINSFILALTWGDFHTLYNTNSYYTWNAYSNKLEPILTDQRTWRKIKLNLTKFTELPFEYSIIFNNSPIREDEYLKSIKKIDQYINNNNSLEMINNYKKIYFPNDRIFKFSPLKENINFLKKIKKK